MWKYKKEQSSQSTHNPALITVSILYVGGWNTGTPYFIAICFIVFRVYRIFLQIEGLW